MKTFSVELDKKEYSIMLASMITRIRELTIRKNVTKEEAVKIFCEEEIAKLVVLKLKLAYFAYGDSHGIV